MKKLITLMIAMVAFLATTSLFALPNFWYSGVAYTPAGALITSGTFTVNVKIGTSYEENHANVPVDAFGVFAVNVGTGTIVTGTLAGVTMTATTKIEMTINSVKVVGKILSGSFGSQAKEVDPLFAASAANDIADGTGFLKNTAGTWSYDNNTYLTAYTETDPIVKAINGIVKSNGSTIAAAVAGTDYLAPAAIGVTVQGYDATILKSADIGVTVQGYNANTTILGSSIDLASAEVTGTLNVANGGTGATTLTGYVIGNGTSAMTASTTIPGADVSGNISGNAANVTGTVAVANGGTGATSTTAYGVVTGGTTSTGALQNAGTGTDGQILVSAGSAALPTWKSGFTTRWFYMPAIALNLAGPYPVTNRTVNLYTQFTGQFNSPVVSSTGATSIPNVPAAATDLYYYVTFLSAGSNITIDGIDENGVMTYDISAAPPAGTFMNVVIMIK